MEHHKDYSTQDISDSQNEKDSESSAYSPEEASEHSSTTSSEVKFSD